MGPRVLNGGRAAFSSLVVNGRDHNSFGFSVWRSCSGIHGVGVWCQGWYNGGTRWYHMVSDVGKGR